MHVVSNIIIFEQYDNDDKEKLVSNKNWKLAIVHIPKIIEIDTILS